jgi:hypothetical protein
MDVADTCRGKCCQGMCIVYCVLCVGDGHSLAALCSDALAYKPAAIAHPIHICSDALTYKPTAIAHPIHIITYELALNH